MSILSQHVLRQNGHAPVVPATTTHHAALHAHARWPLIRASHPAFDADDDPTAIAVHRGNLVAVAGYVEDYHGTRIATKVAKAWLAQALGRMHH